MVGWSQDTIPINIRWDELGYVKMLALAHDDEQCWYYYPDRVYVFFSLPFSVLLAESSIVERYMLYIERR